MNPQMPPTNTEQTQEPLAAIEQDRGDCAYCDEPIPPTRAAGAETCSDGCARSLKRAQESETKAQTKADQLQDEEESQRAALAPQPEPDTRALPMQAASINQDFDRCVRERWIDGQTFLEVRKWDLGELSRWDGNPDHSGWSVVPPTREFTALNSSQLQHRVLSHNPIGGHFQVRIYEMGAKQPNLRGGPFFFHFSPMLPKEASGMADVLPLIQQNQSERERDRERYEAALKEAQAKEDGHLARLLAQQERSAEQARRDNELLRREMAQMKEREEQRRLQERQFQMEQETRRIEATQQSQANGMSQLSSTLSQMFMGNGGMMGGGQQTMAMFGAMFQAQMEQSRIDREMQMERMRLEREQDAKRMELMISLMQGKEPDGSIKEDLRRMEDRYDRLQERYLDAVERKNGGISQASGDPFEQFLDQAEKFQKAQRLFGGGDDKDSGSKDMFDRALDFMDRIGAEEIGKAAAKRLGSGGSTSNDTQDTSRTLPEADTTPPAQRTLPPHERQPNPQPSQTDGGYIHPSQVQSPEDLLVAVAHAIKGNVSPQAFAKELPQAARSQIASFDLAVLQGAVKSLPGMNTPRARRWIEDAYAASKQSG